MLVSLQDILRLAQQKGIAIGAFNVTNMESIRAIIGAAEETKKPVILNWAEVHAPYISMEEAINLMLFYGGRASVPGLPESGSRLIVRVLYQGDASGLHRRDDRCILQAV
jgi:hypothetical protein